MVLLVSKPRHYLQTTPKRTVLSWFLRVLDAVMSISLVGWNAVDAIGVVRCSSDLYGVGKMCWDASDTGVESEEDE
jgi:hypothetical protein